jgi:hypothetical protein
MADNFVTDSIDLQDQNAPSAQDHSRQPSHPAPLGAGPPAPHQADTLRGAALEAKEENHRSPRVSQEWTASEAQQMQQYGDDPATGVTSKLANNNPQQQDNLAVAQNGGLTGSTAEDAEMADAEGDDGMDDDMMDKISSSPSIDDGGYSLSQLWPQRCDLFTRAPKALSSPQACCASSSLCVKTYDHFPSQPSSEFSDKDATLRFGGQLHHLHLPGEYPDETGTGSESNYDRHSTEEDSPRRITTLFPTAEDYAAGYSYEQYHDLEHPVEYILEKDLDILNSEAQGPRHHRVNKSGNAGNNNELENENCTNCQGIPNSPFQSEDEEDDYDIPYSADSRFIDSGWGGECLQELEDIDFEFVYALHTFVATVEGQANATKGDTMVLLDDSNSYWWLVRVVKDSSIG